MKLPSDAKSGLPAPRWCFWVLALPTFVLPLAGMNLLTSLLPFTMEEVMPTPAEWARFIGMLSVLLWLVYFPWIWRSVRLSRQERAGWLLAVAVVGVVAMPLFYGVMMVRYSESVRRPLTGKEEAALQAFLTRHGIDRDRLTARQLEVLGPYCRRDRLQRRFLLVVPVVSVVTFWLGAEQARLGYRMGTVLLPDILATAAQSNAESAVVSTAMIPDMILLLMLIGASVAAAFLTGIVIILQTVHWRWFDRDRKVLVELLRAAADE